MAIAFDQVSSGPGGAASQSITWSHTVTIGGTDRLLLVGVGINVGSVQPNATATYNSIAMSDVGTAQHWETNIWAMQLFALVAPDTGAHDVVVTGSNGNTVAIGGVAISLIGVHQSTPLGTPGGNVVETTDPIQVTGIASAAGEWVVDVAACAYAATVLTADASQDQRGQTYFSNTGDGSQQRRRVGMSTKPGAASVTMQWTGHNVEGGGIIAVPVKPAAASSVTWLRHRA